MIFCCNKIREALINRAQAILEQKHCQPSGWPGILVESINILSRRYEAALRHQEQLVVICVSTKNKSVEVFINHF